jgi:FkbM family methyltransferase
MPTTGFRRYLKLLSNVKNPGEYLFNKGERRNRSLSFTTKPHEINFDVPESLYQVFKEIFMGDVYDIDDLVKKLPGEPVVIDIGANAGYFDVLLLSKLNKANIHAYEPLPHNVKRVQTITTQNKWIEQRLTIHQVAVTGLPQSSLDLYMEDTSDNQVVASAFSNFDERNNSKISVPCVSLTDIIQQNNFTHVDLLKIDCEGSEYDIIYNTDKALVQKIKMMVAEVHDIDNDKNNMAAFGAYLKSLGYSVKHSPINNSCHAMEAVKE